MKEFFYDRLDFKKRKIISVTHPFEMLLSGSGK